MNLLRGSIFTVCLLLSRALGAQVTFQPQHRFQLGDDYHPFWTPASDGAATTLKTRPTTVYRPTSLDDIAAARALSMREGQSMAVEWTPVLVRAPDLEDRHTVSQLARMTANAYKSGKNNWYDLDPVWNTSFPFGWEDAADGFRGHAFVTADNATAVLAIKGTTLSGPSRVKDKLNDNLLFSCCCARVDPSWAWRTVCGCYAGWNKCDNACLSDALIQDSLFYSVGVNLVMQFRAMYPTSDLWLVGHSLGGSLAALLGTTFGLPAVAFEAPGERLAAQRLHLPRPPRSPVTHVYHNADPIPLGTCTGPLSPCAQAGYALETKCHLGRSIVYDAVAQLGWKLDLRHHPIKETVLNVIDDEREWEEGRQVPLAREEQDCEECSQWNFGYYPHHGPESA